MKRFYLYNVYNYTYNYRILIFCYTHPYQEARNCNFSFGRVQTISAPIFRFRSGSTGIWYLDGKTRNERL